MVIELTVEELKSLSKDEPTSPYPVVQTLPNDFRNVDVVQLSTIRLARSGLIINAIKEHRAFTGLGLKESKDVIDLIRGNDCQGIS